MSDKNRTFFLFVIDRSGSMAHPPGFAKEMENGINTFLDDQKAVPGKCRVTVAQFDNVYEEVVSNTKLADVPAVTIVPRGSTALLDSVGRAVTELRDHIKTLDKSKRPAKVLVTIITDGQENASTEWKKEKVQELVKERTEAGWEFSYLGANQDAFAEASTIGVAAANSLHYTAATMDAAMGSHSHNTTAWRTGTATTTQYSGAQRDASDPSWRQHSHTTQTPPSK